MKLPSRDKEDNEELLDISINRRSLGNPVPEKVLKFNSKVKLGERGIAQNLHQI
jgi:hypothetical protein